MCKQPMFSLVKRDDVTRIVFYENGQKVAVLEQNELIKETLIDISVSSENETGRLLCRVVNGEANFVAYENLSLVFHWIKACKVHLEIPL